MSEAAERALVSVPTAYRYFPSADDLWFEASLAATDLDPALAAVADAIESAGDDPAARLEILVRGVGFRMLDDQVPYRRLAKAALEQWFNQAESAGSAKRPVRGGRRNRQIAIVLEPLRGQLPAGDVDRIAHALGLLVGTDAMLALVDGVGLGVPQAKRAMLDASRWLLIGALSELVRPRSTGPSR
jgi:AcrR family transcriptional regulator